LADLPARLAEAGCAGPVLLVVGDAAALAPGFVPQREKAFDINYIAEESRTG
jgi:hypothetical protein